MDARALWHLQETDRGLSQVAEQLAWVRKAIQEPTALGELRERLAKIEREIRTLSAQQRDLDLELQSLTDQIRSLEEALYGGHIRSPREAEAMQQKVEELRRRQQVLEDELLDIMLNLESLEERHAQAKAELDRVTREWERTRQELQAQERTLKEKQAHLQSERERTAAVIPAEILRTYEQLRQAKGGIAVARLEARVCQACGVDVPINVERSVRYGENLVLCPICGRILVV